MDPDRAPPFSSFPLSFLSSPLKEIPSISKCSVAVLHPRKAEYPSLLSPSFLS